MHFCNLGLEGKPVMAAFDGSIRIERPPSIVFEVVCNRLFETQPDWEDGIEAIVPVTDGPMGVGSRAVMERRDLLVWRHKTDYRCAGFEQDRLLIMHNDSRGTHVVSMLSVVPLEEGGTLLRFQVHPQLSGLTKVLEPLARIVLRARTKTLHDMKKYVERDAS
jgi:hypothetical protein